jgi:hypothetical protein
MSILSVFSFRKLLPVLVMAALCVLEQSSERCLAQQPTKVNQEKYDLLETICNNCPQPVQFKVYTKQFEGPRIISDGPTPITPTYGIKVISPPDAVALTQKGDIALLYQLVELLDNKNRGWAAFILLAQITSNDKRILSSNPNRWWSEQGQNGREKKRWSGFLKAMGKDLYWNPQKGYFMYREPIDSARLSISN